MAGAPQDMRGGIAAREIGRGSALQWTIVFWAKARPARRLTVSSAGQVEAEGVNQPVGRHSENGDAHQPKDVMCGK